MVLLPQTHPDLDAATKREMHNKHLVARDIETGASLRRLKGETNEPGLLRTYELMFGPNGWPRGVVRAESDAGAIAEANRLAGWYAWCARASGLPTPARSKAPPCTLTPPVPSAELCAMDRLLGAAKADADGYLARLRLADGNPWPAWWIECFARRHPQPQIADVRMRDLLRTGKKAQREVLHRRKPRTLVQALLGMPSHPWEPNVLHSPHRRLSVMSAIRLLRATAHLDEAHDRLLSFVANQGALTVELLIGWGVTPWLSHQRPAESATDLRRLSDTVVGQLDALRAAGLVALHVHGSPLPRDPSVPVDAVRAWSGDVAGYQARRYAALGLSLPEAHRPRRDRGDVTAYRRELLSRRSDPLGGEPCCQVLVRLTVRGAAYLAARYVEVPGAAAIAEADLLPGTRPWAQQRLDAFFDVDGRLQQPSWWSHIGGATNRWWINAGVLDRLGRWAREPHHSYYRQSAEYCLRAGWTRADAVGGALHPGVLRAGTVRFLSEWSSKPLLWAGVAEPKDSKPDSTHILRVSRGADRVTEYYALCELWRLGPVDARGARHDRDPGLIADKVEALRGRLGPGSIETPHRDADGNHLRLLWPLQRTPVLLVVVPGALSFNPGYPRRTRALSLARVAERVLRDLASRFELQSASPYDAPLVAICELQDLRDLGWTAPIWYLVRAPDAGALVERRWPLLGQDGKPPTPELQTAHDLSGLCLPWRRRTDAGQRVLFSTGGEQVI
jgi:hypothetical protein